MLNGKGTRVTIPKMPDNSGVGTSLEYNVSGRIVAVASAAVGAALFTADLAKIGTSYPAWGLIGLSMLAYLNVTHD